ncbi:hypothetical protein BH10PSE7_BH10PSE7_36580 [soil metagenome]
MPPRPRLSPTDKAIALGADLLGYSVLAMFGYFLILVPAARIAGFGD